MAAADPPDLALWGLHCFCLGARRTPHRAIQSDNNGRILHAALGGTTREALSTAGIPCTESQLALLQLLGLIRVEGAHLCTTFPALGSDAASALRVRSRQAAEDVARSLAPQVARVGEVLASGGREAHQYAVVFGHALDGLLWDHLRAGHRVPSTLLSMERPFWNGVFWAVHPKRDGVAGTNEVSRGNETLVTVWTDENATALRELAAAWQAGRAAPALPVIRAVPDDALHLACDSLAEAAAQALLRLVDELASERFASLTAPQLAVIAGHEFVWDVAENFSTLGQLPKPPASRAEAMAYVRTTR